MVALRWHMEEGSLPPLAADLDVGLTHRVVLNNGAVFSAVRRTIAEHVARPENDGDIEGRRGRGERFRNRWPRPRIVSDLPAVVQQNISH